MDKKAGMDIATVLGQDLARRGSISTSTRWGWVGFLMDLPQVLRRSAMLVRNNKPPMD